MNIGVIGLGFMGKIHLRNYLELGCNVYASDINPKAKTKNCEFFSDYKKLLKKDLDGVSICVPTPLHYKIAKQCLKKTNVLVEKPITTTVKQAEELIKTAKKNKKILMVGHIERYNPAVTKCKKIIKSLGKIENIRTKRVGPWPQRNMGTGIVIDLAVHDIDVMRYLIGEITDIRSSVKYKNKIDYQALILLKFRNDADGRIQVKWSTPQKERLLTIKGSRATCNLNYITQELEIIRSEIRKINVKKEEPMKLELEEFLNCIKKRKNPLTSGKEGMKNLEIALKVLRG